MKAAVHTRYGPPEVVEVLDVEKPTAAANELLVKVHASTVNRTDCAYRMATPPFIRLLTGLRKPKVTILGSEFAGEVEAVGAEVTSFAVGDRVFGYVEGTFGGHGEYLTVKEDASVVHVPDGLDYETVVAGTEGAHYARMLVGATGISRGQRVMLNGATGGVGSAALQQMNERGAVVTAVCAAAHTELVMGLGATRVIDYETEDFVEDAGIYDVVFDAVGKRTFGEVKHLLTAQGCYVSTEMGPWAQNIVLAVFTPLLRGKRVKFPPPRHNKEMVQRFADKMAEGTFTPVIDRTYPLDDIVEAYRYVDGGQKIGNVVIKVAQTT